MQHEQFEAVLLENVLELLCILDVVVHELAAKGNYVRVFHTNPIW